MRKKLFQLLLQTIAALLLCAGAALAQTSSELPVLSEVSREIKGGETHSYRISLTSNQFVHAVVVQDGIDIETAAFANWFDVRLIRYE